MAIGVAGTFSRVGRLAARFIGFIIIPAQVPGDVTKQTQELAHAPLTTLRSWSTKVIAQLIWQILGHKKLTIPDDPILEQMDAARRRFTEHKGWTSIAPVTHGGFKLDACIKEPKSSSSMPRYIIFIGGNMQIYEFWLPYFDLYARDSGVGFLCFNFRGVGRSEGAITCVDDMLNDIGACVNSLISSCEVRPEHILLHGFSIGGALSAVYLASPLAPSGVCITSDRSFRSFCHAAFGIVRGFDAAVGEPKGAYLARSHPDEYEYDDEEADDEGVVDGRGGASGQLRRCIARRLRGCLLCFIALLRALIAQLAIYCFQATNWELNAEAAWPSIRGRKVLVYNRADNIVCYGAASLHGALERQPQQLHSVSIVEVTLRDAGGWAMHDFPLYIDNLAWHSMIAAEREALGLL